MIRDRRAVVPRSTLVKFDVEGDSRCFYLLGDAPLNVPRCLPDLEQSFVRLARDRISVNTRISLRLWRKNFRDGLSHLNYPSDGSFDQSERFRLHPAHILQPILRRSMPSKSLGEAQMSMHFAANPVLKPLWRRGNEKI